MVVVLLKLSYDNGSQVPLSVDAQVRVEKLAVVRGEDVSSRSGDSYLWDTLIPCMEKRQLNLSSSPLQSS